MTSRTPSRPALRTPTRAPRTPARGTLTPTPVRPTPARRRLSIVSESSPPSSPEITFITLPPPLPDRRSPRPNPLRDRQRKAASAPASTPRKRQRTSSPPSAPSRSFVPITQPPLSNIRQSDEAPEQPALPKGLGQGIQIPAPIASNSDFRQFLSDLDADGIRGDVIATPVSDAVVDAMWEACTFLRDTVPGLKSMATVLLREILNRAAYCHVSGPTNEIRFPESREPLQL